MGFSSFTANLNVGGFGGRGGNGGVVEVETARDTQILTAGGNSLASWPNPSVAAAERPKGFPSALPAGSVSTERR